MDELIEQFLIEGRELIEQASNDLVALESDPQNAARLDTVFRAVHTLKGSVALFDFAPMGVALHAAEDVLSAVRAKKAVANSAMIGALLDCIAASERWIGAIASAGRLPESAATEGPRLAAALSAAIGAEPSEDASSEMQPIAAFENEVASRTVRVDAERIDALVNLAGELIIAKNSLSHLMARAAVTSSDLASELASNAAGIERLSGEIHRAAMRMRMVPLGRTFSRFPRWVREMAGKLGKDVQFEIVDKGAEADKSIVDGLFEPLLHVLRNALDHGIEPAEARRAMGKPVRGRIWLEARGEGEQIAVYVKDDGGGIDVAKIRETAVRRGMMSEEAIGALDDAAVTELIFMPGFSTTSTVTEISGRGVGMDSVRTAISVLGGRATMSSIPGVGTTVALTLPQAIQVSTVVTVETGGEQFGVPIESVAEICRISRDRIKPIRDGEAFVLRNRTLPLLRLSDLLQLSVAARLDAAEAVVVIMIAGGQTVGIEVEDVGQRLDVLLRPMAGLLSGMPGVLGTALLGDGGVLLVLDVPELIE